MDMPRRAFVALGAASLGALAAFPAQARGGRGRPTPAELVGTWEGTVLFANGWRGRAKVVLARAPHDALKGSYELTLLDEEGPSEVRQGEVALPSGVDATLLLVTAGEALRWTGVVGPAAPHAEAAFYGSFEGAREQDRGVFMLWRYRA